MVGRLTVAFGALTLFAPGSATSDSASCPRRLASAMLYHMDGYAFIASLIQSVAWPSATAAIAFSQKTAITTFIGKIKSAKAFGAEVGIAEQIEAVREQVEAAPQAPALPAPAQQLPAPKNQEFQNGSGGTVASPSNRMITELSDELAASSAVGSIVASWLQLENGLRNLAAIHGFADDRATTAQTLKTLRSVGALNDETYGAINQLRAIRNKVVHFGDAAISLVDAQNFRKSSKEILSNLGISSSLAAWR